MNLLDKAKSGDKSAFEELILNNQLNNKKWIYIIWLSYQKNEIHFNLLFLVILKSKN